MKVWESPFIPSHLTFKKFEFTHFQSINQTIHPIYLFIITFQNLEFWDVTCVIGHTEITLCANPNHIGPTELHLSPTENPNGH